MKEIILDTEIISLMAFWLGLLLTMTSSTSFALCAFDIVGKDRMVTAATATERYKSFMVISLFTKLND